MKILQITYNDQSAAGGTSAASYRLHCALRRAGHDSKILCRVRNMESEDSISIPRNRLLERGLKELSSRAGLNDLHAVSSFSIRRHPAFRQADVVHLHSLHSGFFNYFALPAISREKPCIWSLHDVWAMTGHCGFSYDCERWKTGCGSCPYPETYPPVRRDATRWEWKFKQQVYRRSKIHLLVASRWLEEKVKQSPLLQNFSVHQIPFGIDTEIFRPINAAAARARWKIPPDKKVLLYISAKLSDFRKGPDLVVKALERLPAGLKKETMLMVMGRGEPGYFQTAGVPVIALGYLESDGEKAEAYSAADLYVCPSRAETFGLTALESLACGTPAIVSQVGGMWEHVRPHETGAVIPSEDIEGLAQAIRELIENDSKRLLMKRCAREMILSEYRETTQLSRYVALYAQLLQVFPDKIKKPRTF